MNRARASAPSIDDASRVVRSIAPTIARVVGAPTIARVVGATRRPRTNDDAGRLVIHRRSARDGFLGAERRDRA
tara:strand:- start:16647 stop:16868 length:222 start_codon:yes stop_codon:yes gene_type:complete